MLDLETQLRRYANDLDRRYPDVTFEEIVGVVVQPALVGQPPGPDGPPGLTRSVASALAAAAVVLVVVGAAVFLAWMFGNDPAPVITEQEETTPTGESAGPLGVIVSGRSGIIVVPFDPSDQPIVLESDELYPDIKWAMSDHRGGLVFTHTITPPPWRPGSVLWLRAGAARPEVLVPPNAFSARIGMATSRDGHALFVYHARGPGLIDGTVTSRIMVADLDAGGSIRELVQLDGSADSDFGRYSVGTGGDVVVTLDRHATGCHTVTVLSVEDGTPIPAGIDCIPGDSYVTGWRTVSHDGRSLGVFGAGWFAGGEPPPTVTVTDLFTGEIIQEATVGADGQLMSGDPGGQLISGPGGWLIVVRTGDGIRLVDLDGAERLRVDWPGLNRGGLLDFYYQPFEFASSASLGSGSAQAPCQPSSAVLPPQDLPEPVAATRQLLFDLAASCDYQALAALALEQRPQLFVQGGTGLPPSYSEEELIQSWVSDGRTGLRDYNIASREPLASLAALLATRPAYVEDIPDWPVFLGPRNPNDPDDMDFNLEPSGCVWVWPAVYVGAEGGPDDWTVWTAHSDYRIGIAADGTWRFFMAGFYEAAAPQPPPCGDG
jgi:hypothetical protein